MTLPTLETINLAGVIPVLILIGGTCALTVVDVFVPPGRKAIVAWLGLLVVVASGNVNCLNLSTLDLHSHANLMNANATQVHFCKADKYCVIQDGTTQPEILNHDDTPWHRRQAAANEVPKGGVMAYGHGRIHDICWTAARCTG